MALRVLRSHHNIHRFYSKFTPPTANPPFWRVCYYGVVKLTIPILEKISLNAIYAGVHWTVRKRHVEDADTAITYAPRITEYTGPYPVYVHYHFRLAGTQLDASNHAYMVKLVEDSMVKHGVIKGDQPKYVAGIFTTAEKVGQHSLDEVEVTISPYPPVFHS